MKCTICNNSGGNMRRCKKCGQLYCTYCSNEGKGHYPKRSSSNSCPWCAALDQSESVK